MSAVVEAEPLQLQPAQSVTPAREMLPLTAERKSLCLDVLVATGGNVTKAASLLGTTRQNIHRWVQTDPVFAELFSEAIEAGTDNLEEKAYLRALDNSDRMTEFLLKARRPEKYREDYTPRVTVNINLDQSGLASFLDSALADVIDVTPERE